MSETSQSLLPEGASQSLLKLQPPLVASLHGALLRRDAGACRVLAEQAGGAKETGAIEPLCTLLTMPGREVGRARRRDWIGARIAAVDALSRIGSPKALPALTDALFDPSPLVREAASFALPIFGAQAAPALIRALRTRTDWDPQSVRLLINTLGGVGSRRATPVLLHVLAEQLPGDPARWARQTFLRPLMVLLTSFSAWWLLQLVTSPVLGWPGYLQLLLELLLNSVVPFLFFYMVLVCVFFVPYLNFSAASERDELACAALDALTALGDRRAIPAVTDLAFGPRTQLRRAARTTLRSLLPLLRPEDAARFPDQAQAQLSRALDDCEPELELEIVKALEIVGSGQAAAEAVARVAIAGASIEARSEAARILPALEERVRLGMAATSLLRAAPPPALAPGQLLRAAEAEPETPPDELLRPS